MRYRAVAHRLISISVSLAVLAAAVASATSADAQDTRPSPASITRTGCLVDEASFARATGLARVDPLTTAMQLVLTAADAAPVRGSTFAITGGRESELVAHRHVLIEITGEVEGVRPVRQNAPPASGVALPPRSSTAPNPDAEAPPRAPSAEGRTPSGAAGVTPRGNAAHEPGDAAAPLPGAEGEVPPNAESPASAPDQPIAIADLPRLNVRTFRVVGGSCGESLLRASTADAEAAVAAPSSDPAAARSVAVEQVAMSGCVIRETSLGAGSTEAATAGTLLLTRATRNEPRSVPTTRGAVPGSPPAGAGTGTVTRPTQQAPSTDAVTEGLTFTLEGRHDELAGLVGQRVSLEGALRTGIAARQQPSSHSTAPAGTILVESVRTVAGSCR